MLCEKCKKNYATVHYRYNENGNITEIHMCSECAKNEGLLYDNGQVSSGIVSDSIFSGDGFGKIPFASFIYPSNIGKMRTLNVKVCPGCGMSENELRSGGKLGCEKCYSVFSDIVNSMLKKMHMSSEYKGKIPDKVDKEMSVSRKIDKLKEDMNRAVEMQEYEEAARIRDLIKSLESEELPSKKENGGGKDEVV